MKVTLLCLPFAGAGASFFRPWRDCGVPGVEVSAVQLPGRERRIAEDPHRDVHEAAAEVADQVRGSALGDGPVAVFGHSLGAVLGYELTRRLRAAGAPVAHLFVSGSPGPWSMRAERASSLPDDEFLAKVAEFADYRHSVFDDPDMRELLLPALRADVAMHEDYRPASTEPVDVPITALRGRDDELVTEAQTAQWSAATAAEFARVELPGGHMYLVESGSTVLSVVADRVAGREPSPCC